MTWLLLSIVIAATVASDLLQSYEMKRIGDARVNLLNTKPDSIHRVPGGLVLQLYGIGSGRAPKLRRPCLGRQFHRRNHPCEIGPEGKRWRTQSRRLFGSAGAASCCWPASV